MAKQAHLLTSALAILLLGLSPQQLAGAKKKKKNTPTGVIAGTVFQPSGLSMRGAKVTVTPAPDQDPPPRDMKAFKGVTDHRGEFAFRVPGGSMRYTVRVEAKGHQPQEKMVTVEWDQRVNIFVRLKASSEEGGASK